MRLIFAGTPDFATPMLQALVDAHEVVAVYTQPDRRAGRGKKLLAPPVKQFALQENIPVFQPLSLKGEVAQISEFNADLMVVVAYGMLLPQSILDIPRLGCINVHASILPRWRGAAPIQRAIEAGDAETGVSIMRMEAGLDTGPVFQILKTPIRNQDTSATMHATLAALGAEGLISVLAQLSQNPEFEPERQNDELATYAKKITKAESEIDWQQGANAIDQKLRAFIPWPVCQTWHTNNRIRLWRASVNNIQQHAAPGTIIAIDDRGIEVACGDGTLVLEELQRDGGKALNCQEFLNGYRLSVGDLLGSATNVSQKTSQNV